MKSKTFATNRKPRSGKFLKWYLGIATFLIVAFLGLLAYASIAYRQKALPATYLLGKNLGGMTTLQSREYFSQNPPFVVGTIKLMVNEEAVPVGANDLGISIDVNQSIDRVMGSQRTQRSIVNPKGLASLFGQKTVITPVFTIDNAVFEQKIAEYTKSFEKAPVNAAIAVENNQVVVKPETVGAKIDVGQAGEAILKYLPGGKVPTIKLNLADVPAEITAADISGAKDYLASHLPGTITLVSNGTKIATMDVATIVSILDQNDLQKSKITINQTALSSWVSKKVAAKINVAAQPIKISAIDDAVLDQGKPGKTTDQKKLASDIAAAIVNNTTNAQIQVSVADVPPETQKIYPGYTPGKYPGHYIEINLAQQMLYLFDGTNMVGSFRISSGKWTMPTPSGEFQVLNKSPRAYSVKYGLYMPYWMGFTNQGHGIHELPEWPSGAKEGESHLGTPVSHGCVRLGVGPAQTAYDFAPIGTPVYVHR